MKFPTNKQILSNRFYKANQNYFIDLLNLVKQYPRQFTRMINAHGKSKQIPRFKYLKTWIYQQIKKFKIIPTTFCQIVQWILLDIIEYRKCPICKKPIINDNANHCSQKCAAKDPNTLLARIKTTQLLYGCDNVFQSNDIKQKISDKLYKEEGVHFTGQLTRKKKNTEKTCLRKYGVKNVNQCPAIKQKGTNTVLSRYDHLFNYCKYEYDNRKFDSSWELMYYIYLKDHNISFEYHKKGLFFIYKENGKIHRFYPDFVVNGEIQEIKGNQFFNNKGEPYNKQYKSWWWEKYYCILNNGIKLLREYDLKYVFEYFNSMYGKSFIKQCLIVRNKIKKK